MSGQEVSVAKAPAGMVWIPGGEFSMGAATNGHGSAEMADAVERRRADSSRSRGWLLDG